MKELSANLQTGNAALFVLIKNIRTRSSRRSRTPAASSSRHPWTRPRRRRYVTRWPAQRSGLGLNGRLSLFSVGRP
jgi:hypothetical protein